MTARFKIILTQSAVRDLEQLSAKNLAKVTAHLYILETSPFRSSKFKKLKAKNIGQWRLEIWPYRVRYDVVDNEVIIYRIRHRKDIYKS